jgi:hypothetical protein
MIKAKYKTEISIFIVLCLFTILFLVFASTTITEIYQQRAPASIHAIVDYVYPRFSIEKNRFPVSFFIEKSFQVVLRLWIVCTSIIGFLVLRKNDNFRKKLSLFWDRRISVQLVVWLRVLFYTFIGYIAWGWYAYLFDYLRVVVFYEPISFYSLLHIPFPSEGVLTFLFVVYGIAIICAVLGVRAVWSAGVTAVLFVFLQGYFHCFGKINHELATIGYGVLLMPFLLYEQSIVENKKVKQKNDVPAWALLLIQVGIAGSYTLAGMEKLLTSGFDWLSPTTFQQYLLSYNKPIGVFIASHTFLSSVLPVLTIVFQVGFISVIFVPKLRFVFIPLGILFHWGTVLMIGVGSFTTPWIFAYLFFIRWDCLSKKVFN